MNLRAKGAGLLAVNMLFWLLMLLAGAGVLALAGALYLALEDVIGQAGSAACAGAALLAVVVILALAIYQMVKPRSDNPAASDPQSASVDDQIRPVIGDQAAEWAREHRGTALLGVAAAGVVVAASPSLRGALLRIVEPPLRQQAARVINRFDDSS